MLSCVQRFSSVQVQPVGLRVGSGLRNKRRLHDLVLWFRVQSVFVEGLTSNSLLGVGIDPYLPL